MKSPVKSPKAICFVKMHGLGNDFIMVHRHGDIETHRAASLAVRLCDRRRGIGADGFIFVLPSRKADFKMRIFNADGSEAEMCGNGIRCVARFVRDERLARKAKLSIETLAGVKQVAIGENDVTVDMGAPVLKSALIPVKWPKANVVEEELLVAAKAACGRDFPSHAEGAPRLRRRSGCDGANAGNRLSFRITCISMGNPHCVVFVNQLRHFPVADIGRRIECHPVFPRRTNVEFVEVVDKNAILQRTWERGVGETDACGTGACAAAFASFLTGRTECDLTVFLQGGPLRISIRKDGRIFMTGGATRVFAGEASPA